LAVLERGYGVIRDPKGHPITREHEFTKGSKINILMNSFEVDAEIRSAPRDISLK